MSLCGVLFTWSRVTYYWQCHQGYDSPMSLTSLCFLSDRWNLLSSLNPSLCISCADSNLCCESVGTAATWYSKDCLTSPHPFLLLLHSCSSCPAFEDVPRALEEVLLMFHLGLSTQESKFLNTLTNYGSQPCSPLQKKPLLPMPRAALLYWSKHKLLTEACQEVIFQNSSSLLTIYSFTSPLPVYQIKAWILSSMVRFQNYPKGTNPLCEHESFR